MSKHGSLAKQNLNKMKENVCCETLPHGPCKEAHASFWILKRRRNYQLHCARLPLSIILWYFPLKIDYTATRIKVNTDGRLDSGQYHLSAKLKWTENDSQNIYKKENSSKWNKMIKIFSKGTYAFRAQPAHSFTFVSGDTTELEAPSILS